MNNTVSDDSSPSGEAASRELEQDRTVISHRPVAAPSEFMRSLSLVELARNLEGRQLHHFAVDRMIGGGGMGAVFRGRDLRLDREVAIKVIPESRRDPETLRRFRMEAQSAAKLDHPNIARVYDIGEDETWNYIVFEFIDGINLRDLVLTEGPLSIDDAVYTTRQVAEALQHAHERDVVHRDIKPSNVIITPTGIAKVVDMGLARDTAMERSTADQTASGVTLGTFDYISPEQARDPRDADVRSDLYSLGCTMFFMLTGQPPFPDGTALQKLLNHGSQPHPDPRQWRDDISDELAAVLSKLMAKRPGDRYQKPNELINDLLMIAQIESLPRARSSGAIVLRPTIVKRSLLEQHLPWLVPASVVLAIAVWLQSDDSFSSPFELPLPSFQPAPPISAALRTPGPGAPGTAANGSGLGSTGLNGASQYGSGVTTTPGSGTSVPAGTVVTPVAAPPSSIPAGTSGSGVPNYGSPNYGLPGSAVAGPLVGSAIATGNPLPSGAPPSNGNGTGALGVASSPATASSESLPKQPTLFPANVEGVPAAPGSNRSDGNAGTLSAWPGGLPAASSGVSGDSESVPRQPGSALSENEVEPAASTPADAVISEGGFDTAVDSSRDSSRGNLRDTMPNASRDLSRDAVRDTIIVRRTQPSQVHENQLWAPSLAVALSQLASLPEVNVIELAESVELQDAIVIPRSGLTIRAVAGQSVEIVLSGAYAIGMGWESWIDVGENSLHCEGLRIVCCNDMRQPQAIFALRPGGQLTLDECLVTLESSLDTVPGACVLIQERDRSDVSRSLVAEATDDKKLDERKMSGEPQLTSISIKNSIVRGYQCLINMRVATKAEIAIEKVCAMLEGRVLAVRGVESSDMPPVVRMSLSQSTLVCRQGFALLQGGNGSLPPVSLMRSSKLCAYWSPAGVPHLLVEGLDSRERLRDLMQLRGEENAYDQNIGTLCEARLIDGSHIDFSFREAAGEWFVERYNDSSLRWQTSVPPDRELEEQTAEDYRLRAGMFIPGYPPNLVIKN